METIHTPAPWSIKKSKYGEQVLILNQKGIQIGKMETGYLGVKQPLEANALLVAAAPDLLQCYIDFVEKVEAGKARSIHSYAQMKEAIKKAIDGV
jgi:hypothetical protein